MKQATKVVGYRLPITEFERLAQEARVQEDPLTASEYARKLVLNRHDEEAHISRLSLEVANLKQEMRELRKDLSLAVRMLMITKGGESVVTTEQADTWVKKNFKYLR